MRRLYVLPLLAMSIFAVLSLFSAQTSFARGNASILNIAKSQLGVREYRGRGSNPRISQYFRRAVGRSYSDSMPWCSAFINYVVKRAGHRGTNSLAARSWTRWGRRTNSPRPGDIVVFTRRGGGHVGIFLGYSGNRVRVIGGNQSNAVSVKTYSRYTVVSYRTSGSGYRGSARMARRARKKRSYRVARGRSSRRLKRARRAAARRMAANVRRKRRVSKRRARNRRRVASLRKQRRRQNRQRISYQQPVYAQPAAPSGPRFSMDGTLN